MTKTVSAEEQIAQLAADIAQRDRQIALLEERNRDLAGYQNEATALRDSNASLDAKLASVSAERDAAVKDAATARGLAANALAAASADSSKVEHATALAKAVKGLLA